MHDGTPADNALLEAGEAVGDASDFQIYARRGVLFDIAAVHGRKRLDAGHTVTPEDLEKASDIQGVTLAQGDVALIRTGWGQLWEQDGYIGHETPGPGLPGGEWLADKGVCLVGSDTAVFEKGPVPEAAPVHRLMLLERKILIMENMDLETLAREGIYSFLFLALPLRIRGGTASPLRPVAIC